jgi:Lrp/AsnC family leucine-responsive transcriptional regulator
MKSTSTDLDDIDVRILNLLRGDGRITHAAIAKRVGLTGPSVYARVQRLERAGVIRGYAAVLDPHAIGQALVAFIRVTTAATPAGQGEALFERFVQKEPQVLECYGVDGEDSYVLKVRTRSTRDLQRLLARIRAIRAVSRTVTTIALDTVKEAGPTSPVDGNARRGDERR